MIRVGSVLPSKVLRPKGKPAPSLVSEVLYLYECWLAALDEALSARRLSPGVETRRYRGERLLRAIDAETPDQAFYGFVLEESESPDLTAMLRDDYFIRREAQRVRRGRVREHKVNAARATRAELRAARAEGTAPAAKPRKAVAPAEPVQAVPPVPTAEPWRAEHASALQSDQAKSEAKALYALWQLARDLPFAHVGDTCALVLRDFETRFPLLARLDTERGGPYRQNLKYLKPLKRTPWLNSDSATEYVIWLAIASLIGIENGVTDDWAAKVLADRAHCKTVILRDKEAYAKAQERNRGRYVRGQRSSYEEEKRLNESTPIFLPPAEMDELIAFNERMREVRED